VATLREIRRRIRSIKSTAQITKAMELVAASKMRRAQERVLAARPYAEKMRNVLADIYQQTKSTGGGALHPLLEYHAAGDSALVLVTADRGLCGAFNANMIRRAIDFVLERQAEGRAVTLVTVGRKGRDFFLRQGIPISADFSGLGDAPKLASVTPIAHHIINGYTASKNNPVPWRDVYLAYSTFVSTMIQRPTIIRILPMEPTHFGEEPVSQLPLDYIYEPNPEELLNQLLPRFVEVQIYQAVLESIASEQSARMVAMRNATDNANELVNALILTANKVRQAVITKELIDITTSASAIKA